MKLYKAANRLVNIIGYEGEINSRHQAVADVMNALYDLDGGAVSGHPFEVMKKHLRERIDFLESCPKENNTVRLVCGAQVSECKSMIKWIESNARGE